ncbi:hypothetical protein KC963_03665 [Candidatus Saccharibacteria bacterium]|nr:hypothetical protein [Candidatus Saccharibacteria bacterium]
MADTVRMNLNVDSDIPAKLAELAGGPKKMGSYLSVLIRQAHAGAVATSNVGELELLSGAVKHLSAKVKEIDGRLQVLEVNSA